MIDNYYVAEKVKEARERLGLTQDEFGKLVGVSKQSICSWEKGRNLPDIINIHKIANLCEKNLSAFFDDKSSFTMAKDNVLTEKERQIINKFRAMGSEQRKALEILLGIRDRHRKI